MCDLLPLDLQIGYYTAALQQRKLTPDYVRYNLIRRPQERRKVDETRKQFIERISDNVRKDPAHYFERYEMHLTMDEIKTNITRAHKLVETFVQWWSTLDITQRDLCYNSGQCEGKYGTCQYLDICSKGDYSRMYQRDAVSPELATK
jgi:hypothetical protein